MSRFGYHISHLRHHNYVNYKQPYLTYLKFKFGKINIYFEVFSVYFSIKVLNKFHIKICHNLKDMNKIKYHKFIVFE